MYPAVSDIEPVIRAGAQFKDLTPPQPWPERGYVVTAWNGALDGAPSADFTLKIGAVDEKIAAFNRFEITLSDVFGSTSLVAAARVERVVAAIVAQLAPSVLDVATRKWLHGRHPSSTSLVPPAVGCPMFARVKVATSKCRTRSPRCRWGMEYCSSRRPKQYIDADPDHVRRAYLLSMALAPVRELENNFATKRT